MAAGASSSSGSDSGAGSPAPAPVGRIGPGRAVLVVGPSGAGKDAVLGEAGRRLAGDAGFLFPRRVVTRAATAAEDHVSLSTAAFEEMLAHGGFALHWQAHGLRYGIPAEADAAVREGRAVVFNTSRRAIPAARARFATTAVVLIDAPLEVRAARLAARNRESATEALARLARVVADFRTAEADLTVDNSGPLQAAVDRLVAWLRAT